MRFLEGAATSRASREVIVAWMAIAMMSSDGAVLARDAGDPIRLAWTEGDVAGMTSILSADGNQEIGFVEYHQTRHGDVLDTVRIAHFADGSSDEDEAVARIDGTLEALRGRSIIRDVHGTPIVDVSIDVAGGHIAGFSQAGNAKTTYDLHEALPQATYWGPLIFIVLKNFNENATDGRLVFHTIAPTPRPRSLDMELVREGSASVQRPGGRLQVSRFVLRPTINWLIDPIIQRIAPQAEFFVDAGSPPALARFEGPRDYSGKEIVLE